MTAKSMAAVLAEHQRKTGIRDTKTHCVCGWVGHCLDDSLVDHVAAALTAAGYGLVADAKREAWDEGHEEAIWMLLSNQDPRRDRPINPYREASNDDQ